MRFLFYSHPTFEPWDWRNPEDPGIGGSETSHVEMCRRLSEAGHKVTSYAPIPDGPDRIKDISLGYSTYKHGPGGVEWAHSDDADFNELGTWVIYRQPDIVDKIPAGGNKIWLICQDIQYPDLTPERAARFDRIVALCQAHADHLRMLLPDELKSRVCVSSNGIKWDENFPYGKGAANRNPRRLMYASSPDRGLEHLLVIFERLKELIPDAELHVFYGFDNIDKVIARGQAAGDSRVQWIKHNKDRMLKKMDDLGVKWYGRMGQTRLAIEWLKSALWVHPSFFRETSCITCMDAQALGAIPITTPIWAIGENVKHGVFIEGNPERDSTVRAQYVLETYRLMLDTERQERIRSKMMPMARQMFNWQNFVKQWQGWATESSQVEHSSEVEVHA